MSESIKLNWYQSPTDTPSFFYEPFNSPQFKMLLLVITDYINEPKILLRFQLYNPSALVQMWRCYKITSKKILQAE